MITIDQQDYNEKHNIILCNIKMTSYLYELILKENDIPINIINNYLKINDILLVQLNKKLNFKNNYSLQIVKKSIIQNNNIEFLSNINC
jgi:hypothetical protein